MKKIGLTCTRITTVLIFAVISAGCTSTPPSIQIGPDAELSFDDLHTVDNNQADQVLDRSNAPMILIPTHLQS